MQLTLEVVVVVKVVSVVVATVVEEEKVVVGLALCGVVDVVMNVV